MRHREQWPCQVEAPNQDSSGFIFGPEFVHFRIWRIFKCRALSLYPLIMKDHQGPSLSTYSMPLAGFGNTFESEAIPGALPRGQNSPQVAPLGLYAEQLSGTAFTAPRHSNLRSWLYRIRPSVVHSPFELHDSLNRGDFRTAPFGDRPPSPQQMRWSPLPIPSHGEKKDFLSGITTLAGNGSVSSGHGCAAHVYVTNAPMEERFFVNADGELLIVPQAGPIQIRTEMGILEAEPCEIAVIPRGVKFQVNPTQNTSRGYICENYGAPFKLPELGPIGANGLAHARDFVSPNAWFETGPSSEFSHELIHKFQGKFWSSQLSHSPLDVVAWHGNYAPYKYDLRKFNTIGTVSYDHPDPSIFTVLTSPSDTVGTANVDFVIFPPRWMVAEHTFRPPYYHRNIMSEFMGLITGIYDAKEEGFLPGGASLHNCMSAHGPDATTFEKASASALSPQKIDQTMAFMFESRYPFETTQAAHEPSLLQGDYWKCWQGLKKNFV